MDEKQLTNSIGATITDFVKQDGLYSYAKLRVFHDGVTGDRRRFSEEMIENYLKPSLPLAPVVGYFCKDEADFIGHHYEQNIYGHIPESAEIYDETDEDGRKFTVADVLLYTGRPDITGIIANHIVGKQHSLELGPDTEYDFSVVNGEPMVTFTKGSVVGLSVLGSNDRPAFENSAFFAENNEQIPAETLKRACAMFSLGEKEETNEETFAKNPEADIEAPEVAAPEVVEVVEVEPEAAPEATVDYEKEIGELKEQLEVLSATIAEKNAEIDALTIKSEQFQKFEDMSSKTIAEQKETILGLESALEKVKVDAEKAALFAEYRDSLGENAEFASLEADKENLSAGQIELSLLKIFKSAAVKGNTIVPFRQLGQGARESERDNFTDLIQKYLK